MDESIYEKYKQAGKIAADARHYGVSLLKPGVRLLDVATKVEIYHLIGKLADGGAAIILISSELPEIMGMADNVLVMHEGIVKGYFARSESSQEKILATALAD